MDDCELEPTLPTNPDSFIRLVIADVKKIPLRDVEVWEEANKKKKKGFLIALFFYPLFFLLSSLNFQFNMTCPTAQSQIRFFFFYPSSLILQHFFFFPTNRLSFIFIPEYIRQKPRLSLLPTANLKQ